MQDLTLVAVIPAAGQSIRFGADNKLLTRVRGRTLIETVAANARASGVAETVVVTGHGRDEIESVLRAEGVRTVYNPDYGLGMGSSIAAGVKAASSFDGVFIWPADMPGIAPGTVRPMRREFRPGGIVVPVFDNRRGHPVLFSSVFREQLISLSADEGARSILACNPSAVREMVVDDAAVLMDVDSIDDLERLADKLDSKCPTGAEEK